MSTEKRTVAALCMFLLLSACAAAPSSPSASITPQIRSGVAHTCLLTGMGDVFCWGQNYSQNFVSSPMDYGKPLQVEGLQATAISSGWYHTCALNPKHEVFCWGQNTNGQVGNDSLQDVSSPAQVSGLDDVISLALGASHSCALTQSGSVYCWGMNSVGQVGDGTTTDRRAPVLIPLSGNATAIAAGSIFSCAQLSEGSVECWGDLEFLPAESDGQQVHVKPMQIPNLDSDVIEMAAGTYHLCVLKASGDVLCEGMIVPPNDPPFVTQSTSTERLKGRVLHIFAGTDFNCILSVEHNVECWGDNYFGQLGNPSGLAEEIPTTIDLKGKHVIEIGGGHYTACALLEDGGVACWGDTSFGQLGDGTARWK